ncbi:MAG: HIT domain-containing protein [Melioribacteraceae bacterium]|nr:HIT domain-containing protein [Melioribacteraceae bacterium]MCF8395106.1 HIT domain-containing protein [Melioribacteraceae bacterium]MCF8420515.1 HIT domain-containing protein [Melioribacteraceae bacterium]
MEKLWSPWRSNYIESFKDKKEDESCIFCKNQNIDESNNESMTIYEGNLCFIALNLYPYNSGHLLVIPKRHISNFTDLTLEEKAEVMELLDRSVKALEESVKPHGFNIGANLGKAAGAGIDQHLHFHIVPRWNGDTNFMPTLGEVKVISQDLIVTKTRMISAFSSVNK